MKRIKLIAPLLLAVTVCLTVSCCSRRADQPNVILVSIDTLRADHLHCYGYGKETSPFLDSLARQGVLFENAIVQANWTLPSHVSMLTSLYPGVHQVQQKTEKMGKPLKTMAEILKGAGYNTAGFVDGGVLSSNFGFSQGFELFDDRSLHEVKDKRVLHWLKRHRTKPFFLFYHTYDVHFPYIHHPHPRNYKDDPQLKNIADRLKEGEFNLTDEEFAKAIVAYCTYKGFYRMIGPDKLAAMRKEKDRFIQERWPKMLSYDADRRYLTEAYDGGIAFVDNRLKKIWERVREMGLDKNTILIVTSDHGECLLEHSALGHPKLLYDEIVRVPLIIVYPPFGTDRVVLKEQVESIDILPTVLDLLGLEYPPALQGSSFLPLIKGQAGGRKAPAYSDAFDISCIRTADWKYIHRDRGKPDLGDSIYAGGKLYNLKKDPLEKENVASSDPDSRKGLEARLLGWQNGNNKLRVDLDLDKPPEKVKLDKATVERLRALGYLQ